MGRVLQIHSDSVESVWAISERLTKTMYSWTWSVKWKQFTLIKDFMKVNQTGRHLKKTLEYNSWNVVIATTKTRTLVRLNNVIYNITDLFKYRCVITFNWNPAEILLQSFYLAHTHRRGNPILLTICLLRCCI